MASTWMAYNELAWTEDWLADPAEYEAEVMVYVDLIKRNAAEPPSTLLHLGSGAGGHDSIFKRYFTVTGVDLRFGHQLNKARIAHPDIEYLEGEICGHCGCKIRQFDAVVIPDSIGLHGFTGRSSTSHSYCRGSESRQTLRDVDRSW